MKNLLISSFQLVRFLFFMKKPEVLFYYPKHFNRGVNGTNPYFEPLIATCKEQGISYALFEEPDGTITQPSNSNAVKADFLLYLIIVVRKILKIFLNTNFAVIERRTARIIDYLFMGRLKIPNVITISNSLVLFFSELNKKGRVFDLQHGVIYSSHSGYFQSSGELSVELQNPNIFLLLYGSGYKNCFFYCSTNNTFENKIRVLGYPVKTEILQNADKMRNKYLFSLQFVSDLSVEELYEMKRLLIMTLEKLSSFNPQVLLKHHPRFNNEIDLSDVLLNFPFVQYTSLNFEQLVSEVHLHFTFHSTSAFEYAEYGVPTYFLSSEILPQSLSIFYDEFQYPLFKDMPLSDVLNSLNNLEEMEKCSDAVTKWYNRFYSKLNELEFINLMKNG